MSKIKNKIAIAVISAVILAITAFLVVTFLPKGQDTKTHTPLIVTNQDSIKIETLGSSSVLMPRVVFGSSSALAFASSDESVCSVNDNGVVTAIGDGIATVTVSADPTGTSDPIEKQVDVIVDRAEQAVTTAWNWQGLSAGSQFSLGAGSSSGLDLSYTSSDENVAKVLPDGTVEAVGPGTAIISADQLGDNAWQPAHAEATVVVAEGNRDRIAALEPFFEAMRVQQQWSWDAAYGGGYVTIENSKTIGNCTTFPTACLIRVGLLPENTIVWPHSRHAKAHPEYFERYTPNNQTARQLVESGQLQVGDIVRTSSPLMHSMIYAGWDNEKDCPLWHTGGRAGGTQGSRPALNKRLKYYESGGICDILRIRTYPVNVSWEGNGICGGGGEVMAKQNCTVTFDAQPGSTLTQLIVDGVEQPITPGMNSYTFEQVLEPHSVEVKFE